MSKLILIIILGLSLSSCAVLTPDKKILINNHTKAVDYYIDQTLFGRSDLERLAKSIKQSNRIMEGWTDGN